MKSKVTLPTLIIILFITLFFLLLPSVPHSRETLLPAVQRAEAMSIMSVNSTVDEPDADVSDNACFSTPSGLCTLRAAVTQAGFNNGPDTIVLQENKIYKLTIPGVEDYNLGGDIDIYSDLTIEVENGGKTTIDGNRPVLNDAVFQIFQGSVTMTGLVIRNSSRGGIQSSGDLTLYDVTVQDNIGFSCSTISFGGIVNSGNLKMYRTTISGNSAYSGGGIKNLGTLLAVNSTISGNSASESGGGIYNVQDGPLLPGTMTLRNTTVTLNKAALCNSGSGGGINNFGLATVNIANSIIANNTRGLIFPSDDDCLGTFNSFGYNLIRTTTGCSIVGTTSGNMFGVDPLLGPLQDNGLLTRTHALLAGSPSIDRGNVVGCKDELGFTLSLDQRGTTRHLDGGTGSARCDMGAYEYDSVLPPPPPASHTSFIPFVAR